MAFGYSFLPGQESATRSQVARPPGTPLQEAVRVLALRLPRAAAPGAIAPQALLQAPGGTGLPFDRSMVMQALAMLAGLPGVPFDAGTGAPRLPGVPFDAGTGATRLGIPWPHITPIRAGEVPPGSWFPRTPEGPPPVPASWQPPPATVSEGPRFGGSAPASDLGRYWNRRSPFGF